MTVSDSLTKALARFPGAQTYRPGDSRDLNQTILRLIRQGRKTVSCDAWSAFEDGTEALPVAGRVDIALDWNRAPALATRTVQVEQVRFCDMTADKVAAQGEFRDLEHWVQGYRSYLARTGHFNTTMPLMVETFQMVHDFGENADV